MVAVFTGIIQEKGRVKAVRSGVRPALEIEATFSGDLAIGESVAVGGVCLTVTAASQGAFEVDVSPETLRVTTLGAARTGDFVNLERAMALGDRLGGHLVSGHIDGVGRLAAARREKNALVLEFEATREVARYLIERGSVAIDGVSLTAFDVEGLTFKVSIIPHTAETTTLRALTRGDRVNMEADLIGKYVEKMFGAGRKSGANELLKEYGYT